MKQEDEYLSRLLPLDELFSLYSKIEDSINTPIDLINANYDYLAKDNSLDFLEKVGLLEKNGSFYRKTESCNTVNDFTKNISSRIRAVFENNLRLMESMVTHYDAQNGRFYGYRNDLPLNYAGLVMLLNDIGIISITETQFYFTKSTLQTTQKANSHSSAKHITLLELENSLMFKKQIGEEAELAVLEYEKQILKEKGIEKEPTQISHVDASAGYDIVSYKEPGSEIPDKFIEVKSCDDGECFYISRNEIETALKKGDDYYLYIFNRKDKSIHIVQNPYKNIIENENWIKESQILRIKRI